MKRVIVASVIAFAALSSAATVVLANSVIALPLPPTRAVSCGSWSAATSSTGAALEAKYGEIRNCVRVNDTWVITTLGQRTPSGQRASGMVATYACAGDATCLDPRIDKGLLHWTITRPPAPASVTLLQTDSDLNRIVVSNGARELYFDLRSLTFSAAH